MLMEAFVMRMVKSLEQDLVDTTEWMISRTKMLDLVKKRICLNCATILTIL